MIDMTDNIPAVPIRDEMIRLGQFLKLANLIESGAEAKEVIADGMVSVNGEVEDRRGRQLRDGDVVEIGGMAAKVGSPRLIPRLLTSSRERRRRPGRCKRSRRG